MNDDDLFLRHALERLAGYPPDEDLAYVNVRHEARAVRRRRAAVGSVLGAGVLAIGVATLAVRPSPKVEEVGASRVTTTIAFEVASTAPASTTSVPLPVPSESPVPSDAPSIIPPIGAQEPLVTTPPTTEPPMTEPPPTEPAPAPTNKPPRTTGQTPRTTVAKPPRTTGRAPDPTPAPPAPPPAPTTGATTTTPETPATDEPSREVVTKTKEVTGGRVVVEWNGRKLKVVEAAPAPGYVATIEKSSGSNVKVVFTDGTREYRVRASWNDGRIVFEVQKTDSASPITTVVPPEEGDAEGGRTRVVVHENGSGVAGGSRDVASRSL